VDTPGTCGWADLDGRAAKGMINQHTGRALSFGIWRPETFRLQIGLNRKTRCQQDRKLGDRSRRQFRRTKHGNVDGHGFAFAGFVPFSVLAWRASGGVGSCGLRHMAVNHSLVVMPFSGMEVKRRQTEEEQKQ